MKNISEKPDSTSGESQGAITAPCMNNQSMGRQLEQIHPKGILAFFAKNALIGMQKSE